jgi:hypothetical protein
MLCSLAGCVLVLEDAVHGLVAAEAAGMKEQTWMCCCCCCRCVLLWWGNAAMGDAPVRRVWCHRRVDTVSPVQLLSHWRHSMQTIRKLFCYADKCPVLP